MLNILAFSQQNINNGKKPQTHIFRKSKFDFQFILKNRNQVMNGLKKRPQKRKYYSSVVEINKNMHLQYSAKPEESADMLVNSYKQEIPNMIKCAKLMQVFKESVQRFKGTNEPVNYRKQYDFTERWQSANKTNYQRNQNLLLNANSACLFIAISVMIHKIPFIWYLSLQSIFEIEYNSIWFIFGIIVILIDILLKIYLLFSQVSKNNDQNKSNAVELFYQIIQVIAGDMVTVFILVFQMILSERVSYKIILDYIAIIIQSYRFYEIYSSVNIILITYKYKNYANLIGFISKMLIIIHFFAIFIYSVTFLHPHRNWLQNIGKDNSEPIQKYVYSLYFIATTMFTVGYGDITPKNMLEIPMIIFIQLSGIILNGYIVSQIGHTLTSIRRKQQQFQHDIQNTDQICEYYQLDKDLKTRVRNYIVNNQLVNQELNIDEENQFMMKLNQELRNQVKHANQLQIIKTSLFFLCNWSKKMQNELAKRLQKFIFSPNERIFNKDKLFIVTKGKIDVFIQRKVGNKVYAKKHLKTIQRQANKQVFSNVYGHTSLFTGRPSKLTAVSKNFAICYALDYADILDIIKDDSKDFEFYHETKVNLQHLRVPQRYEIPNLINNRQNYCPTKWLVLQRYKKCLVDKQERQKHLRKNMKINKLIVQQKQLKVQCEESDSDMASIEDEPTKEKQVEQKNEGLKENSNNNRRRAIYNLNFISFKNNDKKGYMRPQLENKVRQQELKRLLSDQIVLTSYFEVGKEYQKYFKKGNRQAVLSQLNKNQIKQFPLFNSRNMSMQWLDLIVFSSKLSIQPKHKSLIF